MIKSLLSFLSDYSVFIALFVVLGVAFAAKKFWRSRSAHFGSSDSQMSSEEMLGRARTKAYETVERASMRATKAVEDADDRVAKTIAEADRRAELVIGEADKKAAEILKTAELSASDIRKQLDASLQKVLENEAKRLTSVSDELLALYRKSAEDAQHAYMRTLEVASNTITSDAREGMLKFQKFIENEMTRQQNLLTQFIQERRDSAQRELENYKKNSFKKIDEAIYGVLLLVSKEVFGKALDVEMHQELIFRALTEAKKENFFGI